MKENLLDTENRAIESSVSQDKVKDSNLYLDETDSKGVPLLRRIEKYPDLPENEFIPIKYYKSEHQKAFGDRYWINKRGIIKNSETGYILKQSIDKDRYKSSKFQKGNFKKNLIIHRLVAFTFLENPNPSIYKLVNHIDHNPENNNLSNLEWVTPAENNNRNSGRCSSISEDKLMSYIALDDQGNELFEINKLDDKGYDVLCITSSISRGTRYKGYYWKRSRLSKKEEALRLIGFSGNLDDYEWHEHWKYPGLYVCKEGFIKKNVRGVDKILCTLSKADGYINVIFGKGHGKSIRAHRLIMEYVLGRDLIDDEIVDHINTIPYDNSFSNLRITDYKGNMNNPLTVEKLAKRLVLTDLYGDFIGYYFAREVYDFLGKKNTERSRIDSLLVPNIVDKRYICIDLGDKEALYKKMERVVYVFNKDKTKILRTSFKSMKEISKQFKISNVSIQSHIKSGKPLKTGEYILKGPEAVKLVLSLEHGTAGDYKPEDNKNNTESA